MHLEKRNTKLHCNNTMVCSWPQENRMPKKPSPLSSLLRHIHLLKISTKSKEEPIDLDDPSSKKNQEK